MSDIKSNIADLANLAERAEKTLKIISRIANSANRFSTGTIYGCLGFVIGAGLVFSGTIGTSVVAYAPVLVPLGGIGGLLVGILLARDRTDRTNERVVDLIEKAWELREREIARLTKEAKEARRVNSSRAERLEEKITVLQIASPDQLIAHYRLFGRSPISSMSLLGRLAPSQRNLPALPAEVVPPVGGS